MTVTFVGTFVGRFHDTVAVSAETNVEFVVHSFMTGAGNCGWAFWVKVRVAGDSESTAFQFAPALALMVSSVEIERTSLLRLPVNVVEAHRIIELPAAIVGRGALSVTVPTARFVDVTEVGAVQLASSPTQNSTAIS